MLTLFLCVLWQKFILKNIFLRKKLNYIHEEEIKYRNFSIYYTVQIQWNIGKITDIIYARRRTRKNTCQTLF